MAGLLVVVVVVGTPWKAAESALVADILDGEGYALGAGLRVATTQGAQLLGSPLVAQWWRLSVRGPPWVSTRPRSRYPRS